MPEKDSFFQQGDTIETLGSDPEYADRVVADIKAGDAEPLPLSRAARPTTRSPPTGR